MHILPANNLYPQKAFAQRNLSFGMRKIAERDTYDKNDKPNGTAPAYMLSPTGDRQWAEGILYMIAHPQLGAEHKNDLYAPMLQAFLDQPKDKPVLNAEVMFDPKDPTHIISMTLKAKKKAYNDDGLVLTEMLQKTSDKLRKDGILANN